MPAFIYSYQKVYTPYTVIQAVLPDSALVNDELHCTEICTLGGITYLSVPDGVTLPEQPTEIELKPVTPWHTSPGDLYDWAVQQPGARAVPEDELRKAWRA